MKSLLNSEPLLYLFWLLEFLKSILGEWFPACSGSRASGNIRLIWLWSTESSAVMLEFPFLFWKQDNAYHELSWVSLSSYYIIPFYSMLLDHCGTNTDTIKCSCFGCWRLFIDQLQIWVMNDSSSKWIILPWKPHTAHIS